MLLQLDQVAKSFGGLMAVKYVSMDVEAGEILGLIGPNGAGKTTLFNLITGVYTPTAGRIFFDGAEISKVAPHKRCWMGIARTFQLVRVFPKLTVLENVMIGRIYGRDSVRRRSAAKAEALDVLQKVGLSARRRENAESLTLVDRKRLELARALATHPRLLLLDELLAGLDPSEVVAEMDLIRSIRQSGVAVIMVEHLVKAVFGIADRIVVLDAGDKIAVGSPASVAADPVVIEAYLGKALHGHLS